MNRSWFNDFHEDDGYDNLDRKRKMPFKWDHFSRLNNINKSVFTKFSGFAKELFILYERMALL